MNDTRSGEIGEPSREEPWIVPAPMPKEAPIQEPSPQVVPSTPEPAPAEPDLVPV